MQNLFFFCCSLNLLWPNFLNFLQFPQHDAAIENGEQQLTSTKENLKMFIERWEEHPNSPYVFDANTTLILPVHDNEKNTSSGFSSRGCSPSPCESLSSNTELFQNGDNSSVETPNELDANPLNDDNNDSIKSKSSPPQKDLFERPNSSCSLNRENKEYLQSFDRRHSDSNYVLNHTTNLEKMNLAEEIKKLSDRLMMLSSINDELVEYNKQLNDNDKPKTESKKTEILKNLKNSNISNSFSSSMTTTTTIKKSTNDNVLVHSKSLLTQEEASSSSSTQTLTKSSVVNDLTERLKSLDEIPRVFQNIVNIKTESKTFDKLPSSIADRLQSAASLSSSSSASTSPCTIRNGSAPWPISNRRTKFRVTQLSRDVPIGSPDSHQTVFLEEAANTTKDCLLHLLDKYNSKESRSISTIRRHQSISVGHGITDNLECHTMNSLNAFFKRNAFQQSGNTVKKIKARIESNGKPL